MAYRKHFTNQFFKAQICDLKSLPKFCKAESHESHFVQPFYASCWDEQRFRRRQIITLISMPWVLRVLDRNRDKDIFFFFLLPITKLIERKILTKHSASHQRSKIAINVFCPAIIRNLVGSLISYYYFWEKLFGEISNIQLVTKNLQENNISNIKHL